MDGSWLAVMVVMDYAVVINFTIQFSCQRGSVERERMEKKTGRSRGLGMIDRLALPGDGGVSRVLQCCTGRSTIRVHNFPSTTRHRMQKSIVNLDTTRHILPSFIIKIEQHLLEIYCMVSSKTLSSILDRWPYRCRPCNHCCN